MSIRYLRNTVQATNGVPDVNEINAELAKIQDALVYALNRTNNASAPNQMTSVLDMNSQPIINLPFATAQQSPVTLGQVNALIANLASIDLGPFVVPDITGDTAQQALINLLSALDAIGLINDLTSVSNNFSDTVLDLSLVYAAQIDIPVPNNTRREVIIPTNTLGGPVTALVDPGFVPGDRFVLIDVKTSWDENPITIDFPSSGYNYYGDSNTTYIGSTSGNRSLFTYISPEVGFIGA
jgi:hypothetical protein